MRQGSTGPRRGRWPRLRVWTASALSVCSELPRATTWPAVVISIENQRCDSNTFGVYQYTNILYHHSSQYKGKHLILDIRFLALAAWDALDTRTWTTASSESVTSVRQPGWLDLYCWFSESLGPCTSSQHGCQQHYGSSELHIALLSRRIIYRPGPVRHKRSTRWDLFANAFSSAFSKVGFRCTSTGLWGTERIRYR